MSVSAEQQIETEAEEDFEDIFDSIDLDGNDIARVTGKPSSLGPQQAEQQEVFSSCKGVSEVESQGQEVFSSCKGVSEVERQQQGVFSSCKEASEVDIARVTGQPSSLGPQQAEQQEVFSSCKKASEVESRQQQIVHDGRGIVMTSLEEDDEWIEALHSEISREITAAEQWPLQCTYNNHIHNLLGHENPDKHRDREEARRGRDLKRERGGSDFPISREAKVPFGGEGRTVEDGGGNKFIKGNTAFTTTTMDTRARVRVASLGAMGSMAGHFLTSKYVRLHCEKATSGD